MGKPLLVLDMDNTLVFSTTNLALHNYGFDVAGDDGEPLHVIKRPGVDEFLKRVAKVYRVVVYSAGKDDYVNEVVDKLDPERKLVYKRYSASDCEICNCKTCKGGKMKNLKAKAKDLGLDFSRLVWVDDVPGYFEHCKENGMQISKFEGEEDDSALQVLCPVLVALAKLKDFRRAIALYRAGQLKFEAGRLLELDAFTEDWSDKDVLMKVEAGMIRSSTTGYQQQDEHDQSTVEVAMQVQRMNMPARATDSNANPVRQKLASTQACRGTRVQLRIEEKIASKNLIHRYSLDEDSWREIERAAATNKRDNVPAWWTSNFFLPAGFPGSVSQDYLQYMLWQLPTNITAWICRALITSSLLQAVGISTGPGSTAAAAAAIKWVTKDGLGAVGRLFIGGRFGSVFDEDPKQWRMYAEVIGSFGGIFELATPLAPDYFLLLASLGNLTKAVARGLKDPSFRVIQNHFAISENVGDVAAKEEVWEVAGQLIGLSLGVALLSTPVIAISYYRLALSWTIIRSVHLWLRYQSLASLELPTMNLKRLKVLIMEHIQGRPLSGIAECNKKEGLMIPYAFRAPKIRLACSLQEISRIGTTLPELKAMLELYTTEKYVLVAFSSLDTGILLKDGWDNITLLRSIYHAHAYVCMSDGDDIVSLKRSLAKTQTSFESFIIELIAAGWNPSKLVVKVANSSPTYTFETSDKDT